MNGPVLRASELKTGPGRGNRSGHPIFIELFKATMALLLSQFIASMVTLVGGAGSQWGAPPPTPPVRGISTRSNSGGNESTDPLLHEHASRAAADVRYILMNMQYSVIPQN